MTESVNSSATPDQAYPYPDAKGRYGPYGGKYVPETLMYALEELEDAFRATLRDRAFLETLDTYRRDYIGRPTPLYFAQRMTEHLGGAKIYFKREDLAHTGAHKINNALGQVLLAQRMGRRASSPKRRRWPARRRHGHGGRPSRTGMRNLHGRRGYRAPDSTSFACACSVRKVNPVASGSKP